MGVINCDGLSDNRGKSYGKLFIKPYDGEGFTELLPITTSDKLTDEGGIDITAENGSNFDLSMMFPMKPLTPLDEFNMKLFQLMASGEDVRIVFVLPRKYRRKQRKTTYKTIRKDCAKRNKGK